MGFAFTFTVVVQITVLTYVESYQNREILLDSRICYLQSPGINTGGS